MKKNQLKLMAVLCAAIMSVGIISCSKDDDKDQDINNPNNPETPIDPVEPEKDKAMSPVEQKEYLEKIALEFMDMMPASYFQDIVELGKYIKNTYGEDYDWDNVGDWAKDAFDAAREALGTETIDTETYNGWSQTYKYNYIYTNYKALLMASNFTGHFTARNGRWVRENANDLQFIFTDQRSQQCVLKLETSGSVKKVYVSDVNDWTDYDSYSQGDTYVYNEYYDRTQLTIGVPERIIVTLTQGGNDVVKANVNIDLGSITNNEFDISKNNLSVSAVVELNNGYKFEVSKVEYTANTKASLSFIMSRNGNTLITMGAAADVYDLPSINVSTLIKGGFNEHDFDNTNGKVTYVKLDILGKLQIQGTLSNVRKFAEYLKDANDNNRDEKTYKSYINQANSLADINLYYDGKNMKQAAIKMEPFEDENWYRGRYWTIEPVICFYDGSSYSTFAAFFNDKDFKNTIDSFKSLAERYANLFDEHIRW